MNMMRARRFNPVAVSVAWWVCACISVALAADERPVAPGGSAPRPNVVFILADDLGFSDIGCYGGEIATPHLDRLASGGLRMSQMYNTARCWPTRAALLSGYYAQQVNRDPARRRPRWAALLPALLKPAGYRCYHSGKWHIDGDVLPAGFDRSYSFADWDRYFTPSKHWLDDRQLPKVEPGEGYYATTAMAQYAIDFLGEHAEKYADRPFFLYLAFIAPHFPLHALPEDIARYRDRYLEGWDVVRERRWKRLRELGIVNCALSPADPEFTPRYWKEKWREILGPGEIEHAVPWETLTPEQRRFQATKMAIHAAMVDRMDREIGRVLDQIRRMGAWENTLIVFLSDNGADASIMVRGEGHDRAAPPGSAASFLCLGPGWASASNSPFRRHKIWTHEGGISTPCILHWPAVIRSGGALRDTPAHVIDLAPTVLELAGVAPPESWNGQPRPPLPGRSLTPLFERDGGVEREFIYWHHEGNRALRVGDWKIVSERENGGKWELYNLADDRAESNNLADKQPERLQKMAALWERLDREYQQQGQMGGTDRPRRAGQTTRPASRPGTQPTAAAPAQEKRIVLTERALQVHRAGLLIDGHNDLPWQIRKKGGSSFEKLDISKPQPALHTDIPRLRKGGVGGQFWAVYVPAELEKTGGAKKMALEQFDLIHRMIARYPDTFELALTADDVERIHKAGRIASLIGVEGGYTIEGSLETLALFYERGARYMGLTHTATTAWADSGTDEPRHGGLSPFGEQVVREMNRLGMLVDLAHVSADTMRDALRVSRAPVIVSHSGAFGVAPHPRNVPDDVLHMIRDNGGVVMVIFFPGYVHPDGARATADSFEQERALRERYPDPDAFRKAWQAWRDAHPYPAGDVGMVVDHIDYIVRVAGIDHVGIGSDYDGVSKMPVQLEDVSGFPYITQELLNRGYSEADIHKIMGGNLLRALRGAEEVARRLQKPSAAG